MMCKAEDIYYRDPLQIVDLLTDIISSLYFFQLITDNIYAMFLQYIKSAL